MCVHLWTHMCMHIQTPSSTQDACLSQPSVCLSVGLSVCLSVCLSFCPSIHPLCCLWPVLLSLTRVRNGEMARHTTWYWMCGTSFEPSVTTLWLYLCCRLAYTKLLGPALVLCLPAASATLSTFASRIQRSFARCLHQYYQSNFSWPSKHCLKGGISLQRVQSNMLHYAAITYTKAQYSDPLVARW